jgi:hypothetical protein
MIKLLAKANDDVLSHCRCTSSLASIPGQLDCPWCGCGWLIGCTQCRRVFTYACVVEVDTDYQAHVQSDRRRGGYADFDPPELADCASWLEDTLADIPVGATVVYLDGMYFEVDDKPGRFEGIYALHDLPCLPHHAALTDPAGLRATLGEPSYWVDRARPEPAAAD